jgi:hypothetical protein
LPGGSIESSDRDFTVRIERGFRNAREFAQLPLSRGRRRPRRAPGRGGAGGVESAERRSYFRGNGKDMLGLGIVKTSTANSLAVAKAVKEEIARINTSLPKGMAMGITYDSTAVHRRRRDEVYKTLAEAIVLVLLVIWLFLGSLRAALIPAVTVPVCVIAAFMALWAFGFLHQPADACWRWCCRSAWWWTMRSWCWRTRSAAPTSASRPRWRPARHAPGRVRGDGDHRGADRGVRADGLPGGQQRPPVPRTGGGARRRSRDLDVRRAHAHADDVLAADPGRTSACRTVSAAGSTGA